MDGTKWLKMEVTTNTSIKKRKAVSQSPVH